MSPITGIHHTTLLVANLSRSLKFYRDLLGLQLDDKRPDLGFPGVWLQVGQQQIHLMELSNPDPGEGLPEHGGRDRHIAMAVTDLEWITNRLRDAGITHTRSRSGRKALFCRDPDQNALEFMES